MGHIRLAIFTLVTVAIATGCGDGPEGATPDAALPVDANPPDAGLPVDLIANGGFEVGQTDPTGWWDADTSFLGRTYERGWSAEEACSGARSVFIVGPEAPAETFAYWGTTIASDEVDLPFGKSLSLSAEIELDQVTGQGGSIAVRGDAADGEMTIFETTQGLTEIAGTAAWSRYQLKIPALPANTDSILVFLVMLPETTGTVYFDDVSLTYAP